MKAVLFLAALLVASQAHANPVCGKRADIVKRLAEKHDEHRSGAGLNSRGALVEVFAAREGSWTLTVTHPNGWTCLLAVGESWQRDKNRDKGV